MENASKALLMAAGMLLAVMVASLFVLMFSTMSDYTKAYDERKKTEELQAFNAQFEKYEHSGATAQDIVTVINLAKSYNDKMEYEAISVTVTGTTYNQNTTEPHLNEFLNNMSQKKVGTELKTIKYDISFNDDNGKINEITFTENGFFN